MDTLTQSIARPRAEDHYIFFTEEFDCLEYAAEALKRAGFVHHQTSLRSEAVYYTYPGRKGVLRLSAHACRKKSLKLGLDRIAAALTLNFRGTNRNARTIADIRNSVASAIGYYFLNSEREDAS